MPAAIGLGSSLGNRRGWLRFAIARLGATPCIRVRRVSRALATPPLRGSTARGWFLNAVVAVRTTLGPAELLAVCVDIERRAGRRTGLAWGDRTLDVDLLVYGDLVSHTPELRLPHPAIRDRPFVLEPLREVWPTGRDPTGRPWRDGTDAPGVRGVFRSPGLWPRPPETTS